MTDQEHYLTTVAGPVYMGRLDENGELVWEVRPPDGLTWEQWADPMNPAVDDLDPLKHGSTHE